MRAPRVHLITGTSIPHSLPPRSPADRRRSSG